MGRFRRFIVEYIGNLHFWPHADRRADWRARELVDWVKEQMESRRFEAARKRELVHDLRQALRPGDPALGEVGALDAAGDDVSERAGDPKGVSRDAPS